MLAPMRASDLLLTTIAAGRIAVRDLASLFALAFQDDAGGHEDWRHLLHRELASGRADPERSVVALQSGRVAGACRDDLGADGWGGIGPTGVVPTARRRGIGQAIVSAAVAAMEGIGVTRIGLEVATDNTEAQRLYVRLGFLPARGLRVLTARRSDLAASPRAPVERIGRSDALAALARLHPELPAFQRRVAYLRGFTEGLVGHAVFQDGEVVGCVLQRGRAVLDMAAVPPDPAVLAGLAWAASDVSWELRLINVTDDDRVGDGLERLGFKVESRALEMVRGPD